MPNDEESICANLKGVRRRIDDACSAAGRKPEDVCLVAVSKRQPIEAIEAAYKAGHRDFGENYAQDFAERAEALSHLKDIRWHFIGHLQRNKAKLVVPHAALIHAVDSPALLDKIDTLAAKHHRTVEVLIQVNITAEESKSGIQPAELGPLLSCFREKSQTVCSGLMTIASQFSEAKTAFKSLRELRDAEQIAKRKHVSLDVLSMGMTGDFESAIAAGSTMVRVGTAIFGQREA